MIADVIVTVKDRAELAGRSLRSLRECTRRQDFRLTVVHDGDHVDSRRAVSQSVGDVADFVLVSRKNEGLAPSLNRAFAVVEQTNGYYEDDRCPEPGSVSQFVCYCQDDLLYTPGWLERLAKLFVLFESEKKIGFATGAACPEHPTREKISDGVLLKDWVRAAQMFGRRAYWTSMLPIPRFDPETGRVRARPHGGMGSGVDWHFVRNHENSVCRTGRTCLVVPGLVKHAGYDKSTWLSRELPETDEDREFVERDRARETR